MERYLLLQTEVSVEYRALLQPDIVVDSPVGDRSRLEIPKALAVRLETCIPSIFLLVVEMFFQKDASCLMLSVDDKYNGSSLQRAVDCRIMRHMQG